MQLWRRILENSASLFVNLQDVIITRVKLKLIKMKINVLNLKFVAQTIYRVVQRKVDILIFRLLIREETAFPHFLSP